MRIVQLEGQTRGRYKAKYGLIPGENDDDDDEIWCFHGDEYQNCGFWDVIFNTADISGRYLWNVDVSLPNYMASAEEDGSSNNASELYAERMSAWI
jgi:hypothetical protein